MENLTAQCEKQESVFAYRIQNLARNKRLIDEIMGDLKATCSRLKAIGDRINPVNHPNNMPQKEVPRPTIALPFDDSNSGILGQIEKHVNEIELLFGEYSNEVFPDLIRNIEYIEKHI